MAFLGLKALYDFFLTARKHITDDKFFILINYSKTEKERLSTMTKKTVLTNIQNAKVTACEAINKSAQKYVSKNIAECKKVARELKKADATYTKAHAAFSKKHDAPNQQVLINAKAHLEECISGYNTLVGNITSALLTIKDNYDNVYESMKIVDPDKASHHATDYDKYSKKIEKTMLGIAKILKNCKIEK